MNLGTSTKKLQKWSHKLSCASKKVSKTLPTAQESANCCKCTCLNQFNDPTLSSMSNNAQFNDVAVNSTKDSFEGWSN